MAGEVSYRPNAPVLFNTTDILFAGVKSIGVVCLVTRHSLTGNQVKKLTVISVK